MNTYAAKIYICDVEKLEGCDILNLSENFAAVH